MMTGLNLKRLSNREQLVPVLDAEQPLPPAALHEQAAQRPGAVVRIETGGDDEAQPSARPQQGVGGFEKELVQVEVGRALVTERVRRVPEAGRARPGLPPSVVKLAVPAAPRHGEAVLTLGVLLRVAERAPGMAREVRLRAEPPAVVEPIALHPGGREVLALLPQRLLLAVGAVERVDAGEELLGDGLRDVPRRIAEDRVEARARLAEHVRELELPVEEAHLGREPIRYRPGPGRRIGEVARQRGALDLLRRPEPARAPQIHRAPEGPPLRRRLEALPVEAGALRRIVHRQGVHLHEQVQGELVRGEGLLEQILLEEIRTPEKVLEVRRRAAPWRTP